MRNIFFLLLLLPFKTNAQNFLNENKRNNIWFNGYANEYFLAHPNDSIAYAGGVTMNFQQANILSREYNDLDFVGTSTSICDTTGNLLFYTNGLHVGNRNLRKMKGRDTLNAGQTADLLLNDPNQAGVRSYRIHQGSIILPKPNNDSLFYIFHNRAANAPLRDDIGRSVCDKFSYSVINMKRDSGRGEVVKINQPIINYDTLAYGLLSACRHANGRDWWIIVWKYDSNKYMPILFDVQGIHPKGWQRIPRVIGLHTIKGQTCFSPDGRRYARHEGYDFQDSTGNYLDIFDFDRCTGLLFNQTTINIPVNNGGVGSVAFSPNSQILYAGTSFHIFQYDMTAPLAQVATTQDTVGRYDGFLDDGFPTNYYTMQLAPNGKIYLCTGASTQYFHIIDAPNERGTACNVINHGLRLRTYQWQTISNQPYFALGPIDSSACDTLGINNPVATTQNDNVKQSVKVFPNPTSDILNIKVLQNNVSLQYKVYDILGREIQNGILQHQISTQNLPNGIYYLSLYDNNNLIGSRKFVVLHE